jgi:glucose-1-phosphate adenylyltransferase
MGPALAMILAGGRGKRMDIFCHSRPKPALPFAGNTRVIDFTLSNCIHSHLKDIAVLTDYQRSAMAIYLRRWFLGNGNLSNISTIEPRNGSYLGTADAVYQNLRYIENHSADLIMVLAGDHVYKMDYRKMLAFHHKMRADATVGVVSVPIEEAHRFGIVNTDNEERIIDFVEKPELPQSNLVSMGIYVFDKKVLIDRLVEDAELTNSPHDFGHAILPSMVSRDKVFAYKFDGYWRDIGTPEAYYESNMDLLSFKPSFSLDGKWPVLIEQNRHLYPAKKSQQGIIENSLISQGCTIKGRVENSVLSPGVWVDEEAEVRNSIIMANSFIGRHSVVDNCILDEGVTVGKLCYLGFGGSVTPGSRKITIVGEGVTVPPHTAICHNCKILPHVSPDDFAGKVVHSDSVISPRQFTEPIRTKDKEVFINAGQGICTP